MSQFIFNQETMYYESDEEDSPLDLSVKKVNHHFNHHHHHSLQHSNSVTQADVEEYNRQLNLHRPSSRVNYPIHITNSINPFTSIFSLFHNLVHNWPINSVVHPPTNILQEDRGEKVDIEVEEEGETDEGEHGSGDNEECIGSSMSTARKRITRPLTGRYVKNGTGASPSTLIKLREMIREKKRLGPSGPKTFRGHKQRAHANTKKKPLKKRLLQST